MQIVAASQSENSCGQPSSIKVNEVSVGFQWSSRRKTHFCGYFFLYSIPKSIRCRGFTGGTLSSPACTERVVEVSVQGVADGVNVATISARHEDEKLRFPQTPDPQCQPETRVADGDRVYAIARN